MYLSNEQKDVIDKVVNDYEGGFILVNVKDDPGGITYAGITRKYNPTFIGWEIIDQIETRGFSQWDGLKLRDHG